MFRVSIIGAVMLSLLVSPALLFWLGVDYARETGSVVEKIHPSTIVVGLIFVVSVLGSGRLRFKYIKPHELGAGLAILAAVIAFLLVTKRPVSSILVTFVTAILLCYVLGLCSPRAHVSLERIVGGILLINSVIGIGEVLLGTTILPRIAGSAIIYSDTRAIGLVGHPLPSSFITGLVLVYLVLSRMMSKFDTWSVVQIAINSAGLVAFGGRVALVSAVGMIAIYTLLDGYASRRRQPAFVRRLLLVVGGVALAVAMVFSGIANNTIARFVTDGGSAFTRISALQMIGSLSWGELAFGVSPAQKTNIMRVFGTQYGIEVTWIAWLVDYGILGAAALAATLAMILVVCLRGAQRYHWYMAVYFLICITGSLSLGSKTLMLAWFVVIMLSFGKAIGATSSAQVPALATT